MKKPEIEIQKARKLVENFETLPARDIKNITLYLMGAINSKIYHLGEDFDDFERDFLVLSQNNLVPENMAETYFFLKNLAQKEFRKADRNMVVVQGWKNHKYLKKDHFMGLISSIERMINSLE